MSTVPHLRILVVDDEEAIRELVGSYLRTEGFDVAEAADGEDALSQIAQRAPELVVLDLRLPGISGLDVLARDPTDLGDVRDRAHRPRTKPTS